PDRQKILVDGAKGEGKLTFYTSNTWMRKIAEAYGKKYPFIKVSVWRSGSKKLLKRVSEEYSARRYIADVVEASYEGIAPLHRAGVLQEHYSPEAVHYGDHVKRTGKKGIYFWADRELYISLGFNTKIIPPDKAPKTMEDLLDPQWKGKMSISGTNTGIRWVGILLGEMGREYLDKLGRQQIKTQNISGAALAGLVVSGEVPLSPTIYNSNIFTAKKKKAPVEWRPLEPVITSVGYSGLPGKAPNPHAALLFLDYLHSKEGALVGIKGGLGPPRADMESSEKKFKKVYLENKYSVEALAKNFPKWEKLMRRLFGGKR
ncbi:MAG: substrate-binding domain-containing protein, partial [Candidatus Binatia bacterium]